MNQEDNAKKNVDRVNIRLRPILVGLTKKQKENFKKYKILLDNTECTLEDINFKESAIFICKENFASYISYYGMLKVNNIVYPDYSLSGINSMISKSFMIADSKDIRYSKIPLDAFYLEDRDGLIPDSWNGINYKKKDIIIWRLSSSVGIGDNEKMYNGCFSWIEERYIDGKLDWIFYTGSFDSFKSEYEDILNLGLPLYNIVQSGELTKKKKSEIF